jgi:hypothetical protein
MDVSIEKPLLFSDGCFAFSNYGTDPSHFPFAKLRGLPLFFPLVPFFVVMISGGCFTTFNNIRHVMMIYAGVAATRCACELL